MKKVSVRRMLPLLAVVLMAVFGVSVPAHSQEPEKVVSGMTDGIYVNGLKLGEVYTEEQLVAAFGKYDRYVDGEYVEVVAYWYYKLKFDTSLGKNEGYLSYFQRFVARLY